MKRQWTDVPEMEGEMNNGNRSKKALLSSPGDCCVTETGFAQAIGPAMCASPLWVAGWVLRLEVARPALDHPGSYAISTGRP